jgi:hypothetical protein
MRNMWVWIVAAVVLGTGSVWAQTPNEMPLGTKYPIDILPDMSPIWASYSLQDIRIVAANSNDRVVSCDDWTVIDPTPITGQRVLSFTLGSPNLGIGHLRTRREMTSDGWLYYQTTSQLNEDGSCSSIEQPIAIVPVGQTGRWLPLAKFTLYQVTDNGGVGDVVSCQMKRWCCLVSSPTCPVVPPCSLPRRGDDIDAGARDVYPFHFQDQFIPIQDVKSGLYWVEHEINPAQVLIESDYENNKLMFQIYLDQEAGTVEITLPPDDPPQCTIPVLKNPNGFFQGLP